MKRNSEIHGQVGQHSYGTAAGSLKIRYQEIAGKYIEELRRQVLLSLFVQPKMALKLESHCLPLCNTGESATTTKTFSKNAAGIV